MLELLQLDHGEVTGDEREELFPETELDRIQNTMDVTLRISAIQQLERQIELYDRQDTESRAFYLDRKAKCQQRIKDIKLSILGFMQFNGLKNIQTPLATAYQKHVTVKQWPSDDELVAWASDHLPDAIRMKREPDKRLMGEHIKTTGDCPPGYTETTEKRLYLK